jgi:hypothetical protein
MSQPTVGYDGWPLLGDKPMTAGEHRRVGFVFLSGEEAATAFRKAGRFFLWEGRCIGEAVVVHGESWPYTFEPNKGLP